MTERSGDGERDVDAHAPTEAVSGDGTHTGPRSKRSPLSRPSVGRFRIDGPLGSGGMGDVYRAHDSVLDRKVALKILRPDESDEDDAQRRRRVVREARAAAALTHPNTVTIFDVGEDGNDIFIAMELLEGEDLRAKLDRGDASLNQKLRWLREAARALAAAHERGLVHRDVKPENMFVCKDGTLKLLDFGIAKRGDDDAPPRSTTDHPVESIGPSSFKTAVGRRFGTPRYMAPEQHAGEATDPRTDQYAWGLVAFELLTGSLAIDSLPTRTSDGDAEAAAGEIPTARFAELRARVPELPEAIARIVQRSLEPKKDARYPSMTEIVDALEAIPAEPPSSKPREPQSPEPAAPSPEPVAPASAPRPPRRRWLLATIVVAVAATMAVGVRYWPKRPPPVVRPLPPACQVTSTRSVTIAKEDRFGFDFQTRVLVARAIKKGITLERETGRPEGGMEPVKLPPFVAMLEDSYYDLAVSGTAIGKEITDVLVVHQYPTPDQKGNSAVVVFLSPTRSSSQRVFGPVTSLAIDRFLDTPLIVAGASSNTERVFKMPSAIEAYRPGVVSKPEQIELAKAKNVVIAASQDRIAIAYNEAEKIRFMMVDQDFRKVGDIHVVATVDSAPRITFDGHVVSLYWMTDIDGRSRLMTSRLIVGEPSFSPAKPVVDEPATRFVVARLSRNRSGLLWVATVGGSSMLKYAPVGADGRLAQPLEVATARDIMQIMAPYDGQETLSVAFQDRSDSLQVMALSCAPEGVR